MKNIIIIDTKEKTLTLKYISGEEDNKISEMFFCTNVLIGRNGATINKKEGDGKTPLGTFNIGIAFGTHKKEKLSINNNLEYIQINPNLYWIDDINSKNYNKLIDITKQEKDWNSAEHLIDYPIQYEYGIEIKTNHKNIPGKGSAIFIHCSNGVKTAGCIALPKNKMIELLNKIDKECVVKIL